MVLNMKPLVVLSSRDRFARANNVTICGPAEAFLREAINGDFDVTDDLKFRPAMGTPVIVTGYAAAQAWGFRGDLSTERGVVVARHMCPVVATFAPIDCSEVMSHEPEPWEEENDDDKFSGKETAPTARGNFRFWAKYDIRKLLLGERRAEYPRAKVMMGDFAGHLRSIPAGAGVYIDIETHPSTETVQCLAYALDEGPVYSVPIYDHTGTAGVNLVQFWREWIKLMRRCTIIGHNVTFDTSFLGHYHAVPWSTNLADTMVQHHRSYPESEKSLAHVISFWINMAYHKDSAGTFSPRNYNQYTTLREYNVLDVAATRAVFQQQRLLRPDLIPSFDSANRSIEIYLRAGWTGFEFNENVRQAKIKVIDSKLAVLRRVFNNLTGYEVLTTSPVQLADYLFTRLKLQPTHETDAGKPSTDAKALYSLTLKYPKVVSLRVLLTLRDLAKQRDQLTFRPYYKIVRK